MKDISWYWLQHPVRPHERHPNLIPLDCDGIGITAEYMGAMDLVISIDSMAAHLAGALAVPVWTLLSTDADWRWMESRCDSPWYPTMRLFRQDARGDWDGVMEAVRERLLLLQREY
jgi:ADP-heptose:LPS heptosyltransferase